MSNDFRTTSWGLVLTAQDSNAERAGRALAALCEAYWPPLYAFACRRGLDTEEARDLTQAFFTHLLENRGLQKLRPGAGRFRSFLLTSFKNFQADERIKAEALKRGAGKQPIPLDFDSAESGSSIEATDELTPELLFERRWAMTVLQRVMERLRAEFAREGKSVQFDRLRGSLTGERPMPSHRQVAADLEMTEDAVKMAAHRLRKRFAKTLRAEIAETLEEPEAVEDEIRYLLSVLRS